MAPNMTWTDKSVIDKNIARSEPNLVDLHSFVFMKFLGDHLIHMLYVLYTTCYKQEYDAILISSQTLLGHLASSAPSRRFNCSFFYCFL